MNETDKAKEILSRKRRPWMRSLTIRISTVWLTIGTRLRKFSSKYEPNGDAGLPLIRRSTRKSKLKRVCAESLLRH
jgi:hypothetical protein